MSKIKIIHQEDRTVHSLDGKFHNDGDEPAIVYFNGNKFWYKHGDLHRENGPAQIIGSEQSWYRNDSLHREDGPARVDLASEDEEWWFNGRLHRDGGPALTYSFSKKWYKHGYLHNESGAAIVYTGGIQRWFLNGKEIKCSSQEEFNRFVKMKSFW